jgi:putative endonuclease
MRPPARRASDALLASRKAASMANPRHELGRRAEAATARWLTAAGWQVLDRRWRTPSGELDLVCRDPAGCLVAVEVKLRQTGRSGASLDALDRRRLGRLRVALATYARASARPWAALRIDLVSVEPAGDGWRLRRHAGIGDW